MLVCPWGFSWQEYWSGKPFSPPDYLPDSGIEPKSLTSPALAGGFFTWEAQNKKETGETNFNILFNPIWTYQVPWWLNW